MLMIDRKRNQHLLLVHKAEQCLVRVLNIRNSHVTLGFEGDSFRFLRGEKSYPRSVYPELRLRTSGNMVVLWGVN